jgi:AraC-like DNA-binding protein
LRVGGQVMTVRSHAPFRQHFRTLTGVALCRTKKQLRLQEARQLMLNENLDAGTFVFVPANRSPGISSFHYPLCGCERVTTQVGANVSAGGAALDGLLTNLRPAKCVSGRCTLEARTRLRNPRNFSAQRALRRDRPMF